MSFASDLQPVLDDIRGIPGELGLHPFTVTRLTRTWASGTVGHGTYTEASTVLRVGGQNPHVKESSEDAIRHLLGSGSLFREGEWIIGPLTPDVSVDLDAVDVDAGTAAQILYKIEGQGFPSGGKLFRARSVKKDSMLRVNIVLEPASRGGR